MLNDLLAIERGMTAHGVELVGRHADFKDMAKGPAFCVRLDAAGHVCAVDMIAEAGRGAVWTLRDGQHNGFPGLKTASGLLSLDDDARSDHEKRWANDKSSVNRRTELLRLLDASRLDTNQVGSWPNTGHRKRIAERLQQLAPLRDDPVTASVPAVFERFLVALDRSPSFLEGLLTILQEHLNTGGDAWLEPVRAALVGPVALVLDVAEADFQRDAGDLRQIGAVSACLSRGVRDGTTSQSVDGGLCALTGKQAQLHAGNFPQPNLPGLGQTYLFARNRDIPSLTRYGRTADTSFSIDADLVGRLSGVITALTREEKKGRSWRLVPAETGDKSDLLIASLPAYPDAQLADFIADDDEASGESAFFELTSRVIDQSKGVYEHDHSQDEVMIMVLRAVDPANRKAVYQRNTKAVDFFSAAKGWKQATDNTPEWLGFRMPVKGKPEMSFRKPPYVAPLSLVPLSRIQFANGGTRRISVIGVSAEMTFAMFLHEGNFQRNAHAILDLILKRHGALLAGIAAAKANGSAYLKNFDPKTDLRRDALRSVTWLGALLDHLGRKKENYMSDTAFRLGQLLAAVDVVHVGYCADLRGGDVPPTLLGNSVFSTAGADPIKALAILKDRWKPYGAWARQVGRISTKIEKLKDGRDSQLAWNMRNGLSQARRIGPIAEDLAVLLRSDDEAVKKPDNRFKAELLLGYMAGLPPVPKKDSDTASFDDGEDLIDKMEGDGA